MLEIPIRDRVCEMLSYLGLPNGENEVEIICDKCWENITEEDLEMLCQKF